MKKAFLFVAIASLLLFALALVTSCAGGGGGGSKTPNQNNSTDNPPDNPPNNPPDNPPDNPPNNPPDNPPTPSIDVSINQIETDCQTPGVTKVTGYLTVIDQDGLQLTNLGASDFTVTLDSAAVDPADLQLSFVDQIQKPISVSMVMDYSVSITDSPQDQAKMEEAVSGFVDLLGSQDEAEIIKFGTLVKVMQAFSTDKSLLKTAISTDPNAGGWTYLYEALYKAVTDVAARTQRKAVVALTDGREWIQPPGDQSNQALLADLITHAKDTGVPIFLISLGSNVEFDNLEQIASESGGHLYRASHSSELLEIYQEVSETLSVNQYVLSLELPNTGGGAADLAVQVNTNELTDSFTKQFDLCP
jgi:Ca-activated chloride channel family protein